MMKLKKHIPKAAILSAIIITGCYIGRFIGGMIAGFTLCLMIFYIIGIVIQKISADRITARLKTLLQNLKTDQYATDEEPADS